MDVEREAGGGTGCARRRSERRLLSMLRHERVAVAMAVAEATHHYSRGQKSSGRRRSRRRTTAHEHRSDLLREERPGILAEPGPQRSDRTARRSAGDTHPTLGLPVLAGASGEVMDTTSTLAFLSRSLLQLRKEEGEEEKVQEMLEEVRDPGGWNQAIGSDCVQFFWHRRTRRSVWKLLPSASRRKKRRKRKTPKTSSSRRRQRQWHTRPAGFPGDDPLRDVFPSVVVRPEMLGIMAGTDQKDSHVMVPMFRMLKLWSLRSCSPSRSSTSLSRRRGSLSWSRPFVGP